jgi:hypothetical protein
MAKSSDKEFGIDHIDMPTTPLAGVETRWRVPSAGSAESLHDTAADRALRVRSVTAG